MHGCRQAWPDTDALNDDIVILVKQYMSSKRLSQQPVLHIPALMHVPDSGPSVHMPRKTFSHRERTEFMKTASKVRAHPWNLIQAARFLEDVGGECRDGDEY